MSSQERSTRAVTDDDARPEDGAVGNGTVEKGAGENGAVRDEVVEDGQPDIYPIVFRGVDDQADVRELAEAERAVARNGATPEQAAGVREAGRVRRAEHRLDAWREHKT